MFEQEEIGLDIIGVGFILMGIFAMGYTFYNGSFDQMFWFCYIGMIIVGFGILFENGDLIISQLNILTIPAIIWAFDFIILVLTKNSPLGITEYYMRENTIQKIISLQHLFTVPLAFYCLSLVKVKSIGMWKFSFVEGGLLFLFVRIATDPISNVNYAFNASFLPFTFGNLYPLVWLGVSLIAIFVTNFFIIRFAEFNE